MNMKILFIGDTRATAGALHYYNGLIRLGHTVFPVNPEYFRADSPFDRLAVRIRKAPSEKKRRHVHESLLNTTRRTSFDLVFVMSETFLGHETIEAIRSNSPSRPVFVFHSHDNVFFDGILKPEDFLQTLRAYDIACTTKSQNVERYRAAGQFNAFFIPSAYEPTVHRPIGPDESILNRRFPVSFIGTFDRSRLPYLQAVGWDSLHVWGDRWERFAASPSQSSRITAKAIYYLEFADVLSHSDISLGLLREEASDLHTQRTFEIPACGTLQIAPRNEEIASFFEEGKEIVLFDSLEELKDKADYYTRHPTERRTIARRGWERLKNDKHTYVDRLETVLRIASGIDRFRALA